VNFVVSATDVLDGDVTVECAPPSGSIFSVGTTTVTCSAHDASGNTASGFFPVMVNAPATLPCDADGDSDIDINDLILIRSANGQVASAGDPRDGNGDGNINIADARYCQLRMTAR
jgi:hypothetical protein